MMNRQDQERREIRVMKDLRWAGAMLYIYTWRAFDGSVESTRTHPLVLPGEFAPVPNPEGYPEGSDIPATLRLTADEAQVLMDDLWRAGTRPTEGAGSAGALAATERHLEDMRKLAFLALAKPLRAERAAA